MRCTDPNPNRQIAQESLRRRYRFSCCEDHHLAVVFVNSDDAFEFFGGTVRAKYLIGAFNGDDTFATAGTPRAPASNRISPMSASILFASMTRRLSSSISASPRRRGCRARP